MATSDNLLPISADNIVPLISGSALSNKRLKRSCVIGYKKCVWSCSGVLSLKEVISERVVLTDVDFFKHYYPRLKHRPLIKKPLREFSPISFL